MEADFDAFALEWDCWSHTGTVSVAAASKSDAEAKVEAMLADTKNPLGPDDRRIRWTAERREGAPGDTGPTFGVVKGETEKRTTERQSGWDCVVAAPKSVSNVFGARPEYRALIERAHDLAVRRMLVDAEALAGWTRRGKDGQVVEQAKLVVAAFQHASTRRGDELLHTHLLVLLPVVREDGTTGALDPRQLYRHQRTLAQLYRAHLRDRAETSSTNNPYRRGVIR
jgi:hypothetical protein